MILLQIEQYFVLNTQSSLLAVRLGIDIISAFILIRYIYFPIYKTRENVFLFSIFNLLIFTITYLLNEVDIGIGSAFGLFAVFSILRYRTESISAKDMTYIFLLISMGLINAVHVSAWGFLSVINIFLLAVTYVLESGIIMKRESSQLVQYTNIDLIKPENRPELIADLESRLGIKINLITIKKVDLEKETAIIHLCYYHCDKQKDYGNSFSEIKKKHKKHEHDAHLKMNGKLKEMNGKVKEMNGAKVGLLKRKDVIPKRRGIIINE